MLKNTIITGFADEIHSDIEIQVKLLKELGISHLELRSAWGKNIADFTLEEAKKLKKYLTEQVYRKPVIIIDYPNEIKSFYMKQNEDGKTVRAMDILVPRLGEIIGGSERESDYDKLINRIEEFKLNPEDYWWYLELRRFGTVPHSGFGLGFERLVQFATGMKNIRDVIPFPRSYREAGL